MVGFTLKPSRYLKIVYVWHQLGFSKQKFVIFVKNVIFYRQKMFRLKTKPQVSKNTYTYF